MSGGVSQGARVDAIGRVLRTGDGLVRRQVQFDYQMSAGHQKVGEFPDKVQIDVMDDDDQFKGALHTMTGVEVARDPLYG